MRVALPSARLFLPYAPREGLVLETAPLIRSHRCPEGVHEVHMLAVVHPDCWEAVESENAAANSADDVSERIVDREVAL